MATENCNPPKVDDWSEISIFEVVLGAQENIPGAKAELARREKEAQELDKSADIEKGNPNRDPRTGQFTFGAGGPQAGSGGGSAGAGDAESGEAGAAEPYEETDNYRMQHQPLTRADEFGSPATDIGSEMMPGFYENPNLYGSGYAEADKESRRVLVSIKDKPDAPVTIYRTVPESVDTINPGDWVTLSPTYAQEHLRSNVLGGKVISQVVPARDLWFDGNSINEFGYDPVSTSKSVTNTPPELLHAQKDIDTVSSKALDLSQIRVEWIEE
jgi:hypothetical protein